ncbi:MAG: ATP-binding protein [Clostridia bacterium]|nr:ATP-binding protein [Clostridia bacterium]
MENKERLSIQSELNEKRLRALAEADRRQAETEAAIPALGNINRLIRSVGPRLLALGIQGGDDYEARSKELYLEHEALVDEKMALLKANGYPEDYDLPVFECKECNDTGFVGPMPCSCVKRERAKRAYYNSGLGKALEKQTFESLDMRYYSGTTAKGFSVKDIMTNHVEYCKDYAENFCRGADNLLMIGGSGLGKTHIASAIGHVVINKGFEVVYESAQRIIDAFETERFGKGSEEGTSRFTDCDLLIMDDLGTEFNTSFTLSALFGLLNHRIINGLSTIITTNLSFAEIEEKYKERICSRLRGEYNALVFCGRDIRRVKKENR